MPSTEDISQHSKHHISLFTISWTCIAYLYPKILITFILHGLYETIHLKTSTSKLTTLPCHNSLTTEQLPRVSDLIFYIWCVTNFLHYIAVAWLRSSVNLGIKRKKLLSILFYIQKRQYLPPSLCPGESAILQEYFSKCNRNNCFQVVAVIRRLNSLQAPCDATADRHQSVIYLSGFPGTKAVKPEMVPAVLP